MTTQDKIRETICILVNKFQCQCRRCPKYRIENCDRVITAITKIIEKEKGKSICKFTCPHIVFINNGYYWVQKVRKEHPLQKGEIFRCHHCHKNIIPRKQGSGRLTAEDLAEKGIYPQEADMI